jgi:predicted glycogen debranching enzyme
MDARVDGRAVTPRSGKPVEIQALWYNALKFTARLAHDFGDENRRADLEVRAEKAAAAFVDTFWNEDAGWLCDTVDGNNRDRSLRPNQLIALSLGYCAVPEDCARRVIAAVEQHLLTPFGLRTLAPFEPGYCGQCTGPIPERDGAYHQGTIWPWLLGPFLAADARFNSEAAPARKQRILEPLRAFVLGRGTGQIAEIFDANEPFEPRGCFAQAWSVAEVLRLALARGKSAHG